jgi:hypothetical protein
MHSHAGTKGDAYRTKNQLLHLARIITIKKSEFTLEHATKAFKGSSPIHLPLFNLGARWQWVVKVTSILLYPRERPGGHCIGGWLGPRDGLDLC